MPDYYYELRYQQVAAMEAALEAIDDLGAELEALTGRRYRTVERYRLEDAEHAIVALGSTAGTVKDVVDALRERGESVGLLRIGSFRPFPTAAVRDALAQRTGRPVTFGWGPRFLHSTGQLHKGGAPIGVYLQITGEPDGDLDVPDRPFTFGRLLAAQAAGDATVLADHGRPVLRLHVTDHAALERLTGLLGAQEATA
jgi:hypothetical protein